MDRSTRYLAAFSLLMISLALFSLWAKHDFDVVDQFTLLCAVAVNLGFSVMFFLDAYLEVKD